MSIQLLPNLIAIMNKIVTYELFENKIEYGVTADALLNLMTCISDASSKAKRMKTLYIITPTKIWIMQRIVLLQ